MVSTPGAEPAPGRLREGTDLDLRSRQLDVVRARLCTGAIGAMESLARAGLSGPTVEVEGVLACPLADFSEAAVGGTGDTIAGASLRFEGPVAGTALLAMDPEDAVAWMRAGDGVVSVERFLALAQRLVAELVAAALSFDAPVVVAGASLQESTLGGAVVGTHAPSDTLVLAATLRLGVDDGVDRPAVAILLVDPKPLLPRLLAPPPPAPEAPADPARASDVEPAALVAGVPDAD